MQSFPEPKDAHWLTEEATEFLASQTIAAMEPIRQLTFLREKCGLTASQASCILQQWECRRRAGEKFSHPETLFYTPTGLEQSTDEWVAQYKASRFPANVPIADVCCGIGGDLRALAARGPVLGIERDAAIAWFATKNLNALENSKKYSRTVEAIDAETFLQRYRPEQYPCIHIDPDRRPAGFRSTQMEFFAPPPEVLEKLLADRQLAAVKLAPGGNLPEHWPAQWEWIGRDRQCRQLVAWLGKNVQPGFCATLLEAHSSTVLRTLQGRQNLPIPAAEQPGKYLFDIDSTVLAAQLEGALAAEHHLKTIFPGTLYLTGNTPIFQDAALACFEILQILPFDRKRLQRAVTAQGWGQLEIKKRGATPTPEEVRRWLKLSPNKTSGTLFLLRTSHGITAILAHTPYKATPQ